MICGRDRPCPCKWMRYSIMRSHDTRIFWSSIGVCKWIQHSKWESFPTTYHFHLISSLYCMQKLSESSPIVHHYETIYLHINLNISVVSRLSAGYNFSRKANLQLQTLLYSKLWACPMYRTLSSSSFLFSPFLLSCTPPFLVSLPLLSC